MSKNIIWVFLKNTHFQLFKIKSSLLCLSYLYIQWIFLKKGNEICENQQYVVRSSQIQPLNFYSFDGACLSVHVIFLMKTSYSNQLMTSLAQLILKDWQQGFKCRVVNHTCGVSSCILEKGIPPVIFIFS